PYCLYLCSPRLTFSFHHPAHSYVYTLSLHDALPISPDPSVESFCSSRRSSSRCYDGSAGGRNVSIVPAARLSRFHSSSTLSSKSDRKSTRLNSSHVKISYAVFCLKKKKRQHTT